MAAELSPEEEQATKQFLEEINKWTVQYNVSPLSWNVAVKFLMARKFDVLRAIELFHSYRETRLKEGIVKLKPHEEPLRSELLSGKFTILAKHTQLLPHKASSPDSLHTFQLVSIFLKLWYPELDTVFLMGSE